MLKMNKSVLFLFTILLVHKASAFKVLVAFPYPGKSHTILGEGYVRNLLKAGHEVTYITPILMKEQLNLRQVDVSSNFKGFPLDSILDFTKVISDEVSLKNINVMFDIMLEIANNSITHENVQKFIQDPKEQYDVVISEWLYSELYAGFAAVFDCPFIWSSSLEPHSMILALIDDLPNPAYTPDHMSTIDPPFTFLQRASELWNIIKWKYYKWTMADKEEITFRNAFGPAVAKRGRILPKLEEIKYNASLMFGNAHVSSGMAVRLPQNHISIAGYHINDKVAPLPDDLQKIMDNAPNGVIYFSMGTMVKSKTMPETMKKDILKVFSTLKQTVIWKYEEIRTDLPKNVHIVQWAPQTSILAHPNCVLFITHGGLLSTTETLRFGVPIIGIPIFADQFINVQRAVNKGFAKKLDLNLNLPANLKIAIQDMLENPSYREKVKELSIVYHHRPMSPGDEVVHWVEHVAMTHGAPHLRSPALHVPFYQKLYLDLLFIVIGVIIIIIKAVKIVLSYFTNKANVKQKRS